MHHAAAGGDLEILRFLESGAKRQPQDLEGQLWIWHSIMAMLKSFAF